MAEEAFSAGWDAILILHDQTLNARGRSLVRAYQGKGAPIETVSEDMMQRISDTESPQGILIVLRKKQFEALPKLDFAVILDGVRDPGNLGTIFRAAAAAGVQAVFLPPGNVDPFSPKVVRAGMGAHFRMPIFTVQWNEITERVRQARLRCFLAAAGEGKPLYQVDFRQPLALIIGGEASGAGVGSRALADDYVHIPLHANVESLNVSTAAAILFYEVVRQREPSI